MFDGRTNAMAKRRRVSEAELFEQAIEENDLAQVKFALRHHRAKINEQDEHGVTVLHKSCFRGQLEIVRLLVEHGAEIEAPDGNGWTCLHYASHGGHVDVVNFLLNSLAEVTATTYDGKLPIDVAKGEGTVFLLASAIIRAGKENLLLRYMDGSTSSLESMQSCDGGRPQVQGSMSEEMLRASQQFLAQTFGAYLDARFNLNKSWDKSVDSKDDRFLGISNANAKLTRNTSCPVCNVNNAQERDTGSKRKRLNCFKSSFSPDVLQRFAVSETNLNEQVVSKGEDSKVDINRVPNFFDLNNVNSETWINS